PSAIRALALLWVASPTPDVRRVACETLARRDAREAIRMLVELIQDPEPHPNSVFFRVQAVPVGAFGVGSPGMTSIVNRTGRWLRVYTVDETFSPRFAVNSYDYENRVDTINHVQSAEFEMFANLMIQQSLSEILPARARIRELNDRLIGDLKRITGEDHGDDWESWTRWWVEDQGYAYDSTRFRSAPEAPLSADAPAEVSRFHYSCFAAGTPVLTILGPRVIESIRIGDRVLGQDGTTGELSFAPVRARLHNKPAATLRVEIDGEPIVATGIHRFWKVGQGWVMARDLKSGDAVRILGGVGRVSSVGLAPTQPVYNLEGGESQSFFVGRTAALVHDNSPVVPVRQPFDSVPEFTKLSTTRRQSAD
ncbi:polymorphic toxin-type HINT domain-containing protein, partial [Singulisphaera rosea]